MGDSQQASKDALRDAREAAATERRYRRDALEAAMKEVHEAAAVVMPKPKPA